MSDQPTDATLESVLELTAKCRTAHESGDLDGCIRIMAERDAAYSRLHPFDALTYIEWARGRIPDESGEQAESSVEEHW